MAVVTDVFSKMCLNQCEMQISFYTLLGSNLRPIRRLFK